MKSGLWGTVFCVSLFRVATSAGAELTQELTTDWKHHVFPSRVTSSPFGRNDRDPLFANFAFSRFDTNLGTLSSVSVKLTTQFHPRFFGSSPPPRTASTATTLTANHILTPPHSTSPLTRQLDYAATLDFQRIPPVTTVDFDYGLKEGETDFVELPTVALANYQGAGQVTLPLTINCDTFANISNGMMTYNFSADYKTTVSLRYVYIPFMITSLTATNVDQLAIAWNSKPGLTYQIQAKASLDAVEWGAVTNVTALISNTTAIVSLGGSEKFYRITIP